MLNISISTVLNYNVLPLKKEAFCAPVFEALKYLLKTSLCFNRDKVQLNNYGHIWAILLIWLTDITLKENQQYQPKTYIFCKIRSQVSTVEYQ